MILGVIMIGLLFGVQDAAMPLQFEALSVNDGLSQSSPRVILQDRTGLIWMGTHDGLNRFDGYEFDVFYHDPSDPASISDDFVLSLAEDDQGFLWVGTNGGGLNRFDKVTEKFEHFESDAGDENTISHNSVNALLIDNQGRLWIGTRAGLDLFHQKNRRFQRYLTEFEDFGAFGVGALYEDRRGRFWVGTFGGGLLRFDRETGTYVQFSPSYEDPSSFPDAVVTAITEDHKGVLWIGGNSGRLITFDGQGGFKIVNDSLGDEIRINSPVSDIMEDSTGNIWVGFSGNGVVRRDAENHVWTQYVNDPGDPLSLANNFVFTILEDTSGSIWVGTGGGGISKTNTYKRKFQHFRKQRTASGSQPANFIWTIEEGAFGTGEVFWIGTQGAGLQRFERSSCSYTQVEFGDAQDVPADVTILDVCVPQKGDGDVLWIATQGSGLLRMDRESGRLIQFTNEPDDSSSLSSNAIRTILEDGQGGFWLGTTGGGVNRFDPKTGRCRRYLHRRDDADSLSHNVVLSIFEDRSGILWVGTQGGGLNRLDPVRQAFTRFEHDPDDDRSLSNDRVRVVMEVPQQLLDDASSQTAKPLWVGTDHGLNRLDRSTQDFKTFTVKDGLPNNVIYGILPDRQGRLWISTNRGLSRFDPCSESFRNFDYEDGLQSNEFNTGAFCRARSGELVFGGVNGFNIFDPMTVVDNPHVPPIVITEFRVSNREVMLEPTGHGSLGEAGDDPIEVALSYEDDVFSFEFAALDYANPEKNQYAYRLEGFQDDWNYCGNRRTATYTNLDPGDYVFHVMGANNDGVWNPEPVSVKVTIAPPFWKTGPAYILYGLAAITFLFGLRKFELDRERARASVMASELRAQAAEAKARAIASENARKTMELEEARKLQLSMLPESLPCVPNADIAAYMRPATEVGGDYYDFLVGRDGTLTVAVGDATGHGIKAGMMVAMTKERFFADGAQDDMAEFFEKSNRVFRQMGLDNLYMSLTLVKIRDGQMQAACAGMPAIYIYQAQTQSIRQVNPRSMPLGGVENFVYQEERTQVHPGDCILLFTDGLPELFNPHDEMFEYVEVGREFAKVADQSPQDIIDHLVAVGEEWRGSRPQDDDITFVVVKIADTGSTAGAHPSPASQLDDG